MLYNKGVKKQIYASLFILAVVFAFLLATTPVQAETNQAYYACEQIPASPMKGACQTCAGDLEGDPQGVWTAIGCIPVNPQKMVKAGVYLGISIAGGVGMLSIIMAGFLYSLSAGDANKTSQARELMTSSVIGLLFIIFSITMMQFIATDLLKIPGFSQ